MIFSQLKLLTVSILHDLMVTIAACNIHTDVFLSLNGNVIPDNGLLNINDIGSNDNTALLCITNLPPTGANSGGDWFAPNGRVGDDMVPDPGFNRNRGPMVVRLLRTVSGTPTQGIYHCVIEDSKPTFETVNVGLYNSGGGKNK